MRQPAAQTLRRWRHSIKARLVAVFVLLALALSAVFVAGLQRLLHAGWEVYARPLVADYADRLVAEIGTPPDPAKVRALTERLPLAVRIEGPLVQLQSHPPRPWQTRHHDAHEAEREGAFTRTTADGHRVSFSLTAPPPGSRPRLLGWVTLAALLLLTAIAYAAARHVLRPLSDISAGVEAFAQGRFDQPIVPRRNDELGELAGRINHMATQVSGMLDAKRALLLAISHELRSPLTRARVNAELLEDSPERHALLRDLAEMRDLITDLLESERLAQGHAALAAEAVDLGALLREVAASAPVPLELALEPGLKTPTAAVQADPARLRLLLRNLIHNAQRHAAQALTPPTLFLRREADGRLAMGLRDHGPGVPEPRQRRCGPGPAPVPTGGPSPWWRASAAACPAGVGGGDGVGGAALRPEGFEAVC
jgi:signal transduction histidine kinase